MAAPPNLRGGSPEEEPGGCIGGAIGGSDVSRGGAGGFPSGVDEGDCCGSSNPAASLFRSPVKRATTAVARAWRENPSSNERYTSGIDGGIELDDDIWVVRFNLEGRANYERSICKSDITYMNLLAMIESEGYGVTDNVYYVKVEGAELAGMELCDGMSKVQTMVEQYNEKKALNLTVMRGNDKPFAGINSGNDEGVVFPTQDCPSTVEDCLMTQQSNICQKKKDKQVQQHIESDSDECPETFEETSKREYAELNQKLIDMKRNKSDPLLHCDGDTEPEDLFYESDGSANDNDCNIVAEPEPKPEPESVRKKLIPKRTKGPTNRSHCSQASKAPPDFVPSSDDGMDGDLGADDDDDGEQMKWVLQSGRKSRAKKKAPRVWYDESRIHAEVLYKLSWVIISSNIQGSKTIYRQCLKQTLAVHASSLQRLYQSILLPTLDFMGCFIAWEHLFKVSSMVVGLS